MNDLSTLDGLRKELEARDSKIKHLEYKISRLRDLAIKGQKMTEEGRFLKTPVRDIIEAFSHNSVKEYNKSLKPPRTDEDKKNDELMYLRDLERQADEWDAGKIQRYCQYENNSETPNPFRRILEQHNART